MSIQSANGQGAGGGGSALIGRARGQSQDRTRQMIGRCGLSRSQRELMGTIASPWVLEDIKLEIARVMRKIQRLTR